MDAHIRACFDNLKAKDKTLQYEAFTTLLTTMKEPVDWAYDVWDKLVQDTNDNHPHERSRAAQFLSYLAISDPEKRILKDFHSVWGVTHNEKFVPKRHTLQAIWRIGLAGSEQKEMIVSKLYDRFEHCGDEKNCTLIRNDILVGLHQLYKATNDDAIKERAHELIEIEADPKYKKKYQSIWK